MRKRTIVLSFIGLMIAAGVLLFAIHGALAGTYARGDANQDNRIDVGDLVMMQRQLMGLNPVVPSSDANADGAFNVGDYIYTVRVILGISPVKE